MSDWILRIEGTNLSQTVFNTNALSVIRGASLVLEAFGYELEAELTAAGIRFERVYLASSQAVFLLKDTDAAGASRARTLVQTRLTAPQTVGAYAPALIDRQGGDPADDLNLKMPSEHMTFVITLLDLKKSVALTDEATLSGALKTARLIAQRMQMAEPGLPRSPGVRVAHPGAPARAALQCQIDPTQQVPEGADPGACVWVSADRYTDAPAVRTTPNNGPVLRKFSKRSAALWKYGRNGRKQLYDLMVEKTRYNDLLNQGLDREFGFAESFVDISDITDCGLDLPPSLGGKLAVLYIDGSGFGKRAAEHPVSFPKAVSAILDDLFFDLVSTFLRNARGAQANAWVNPNRKVRRILRDRRADVTPLRLEALYAGGDDALLVFPSFLAFDLTERVMATLRATADRHPVMQGATFRGGLAIADSGIPFRRLRSLAFALMNDGKKAYPDKDTPIDAISVAILEGGSLQDDGDASLAALRAPLGGSDVVGPAFRFSPAGFARMRTGMRRLQQKEAGLAKSVLHEIVARLDASADAGTFARALAEHGDRGRSPISADDLAAALPGTTDMPISLRLKIAAELWDYADPMKTGPTQEGGAA